MFVGYVGTTAAGGKYCFNLTRLRLETLEITRHEGGRLGCLEVMLLFRLCIHVGALYFKMACSRGCKPGGHVARDTPKPSELQQSFTSEPVASRMVG